MSRNSNEVGRRTFIKGVAAGAAGAGLVGSFAGELLAEDSTAVVPVQTRRVLGRTGREVSTISVGCGGIRTEHARLLQAAVERGINFLDTAWGYGNGQSELGVGEFLKNYPHRDKLFINTKATGFNPPRGTARQVYDAFKAKLTESLARMKTDYVDLMMWPHGAAKPESLRNPAMQEALRKLKEEGLIRHFGTSSHTNYRAVCDAALDDGFYDVLLTVINICTQNVAAAGEVQGTGRRGGRPVEDTRDVLKKAKEKNIGMMAMKVANPGFLRSGTDGLLAQAFPGESSLSRHQKLYTYGRLQAGVSTVVVGMRSATHLKEALEVGAS